MTTQGVTYDTGALIAAEKNRDQVSKMRKKTLSQGLTPTVPAGVPAQAWVAVRSLCSPGS